MTGKAEQPKHESLYWEFPSYGGQQALRYGKWKAVRQRMFHTEGEIQLYDLSVDIGENYDVARSQRQLVDQIATMMSNSRVPSELFPFKPLDGDD